MIQLLHNKKKQQDKTAYDIILLKEYSMNIALFTETYLPDINGVAAHVKTLRDGLIALDHRVMVVAADKHARHHYLDSDGVLHCPGVESKKFYGFGVASPISAKRQRIIAGFKPNIIHIHHEFGVGLSGISAAKKENLPLVYTLHTMYDQYVYYIAPKPFMKAATNISHRYEKFIASRANALTGPSQKCHEYFNRIGVDKDFNLIPNSADLSAFDPSKFTQEQDLALREKLGIDPNKTIVVFVGRMGQEKSVDIMMDYWAQSIVPQDNLHLLLIGDGPDLKSLQQHANSLGIQDQVTFTGRVEHDVIPSYYAMSDVFATASLSEMNSISMLEGMASGLPTLQRYDELNADQIQTGINGYLFRTPQEFGAYLKNIANMSFQEKQEMKEIVRKSVEDRGSVGLAKYMLGVYDKAIAEKYAVAAQR